MWNEHTIIARGLITDLEGKIHARSFAKFFNLGEAPGPALSELPDETPVVTEKLDGFLGFTYWHEPSKQVRVASRGSFKSEYAMYATRWLQTNNKSATFDVLEQVKYSYVFEILYSAQRIVVDNSSRYGLTLLTAFDNETGEELDRQQLEVRAKLYRWPIVRQYDFAPDGFIGNDKKHWGPLASWVSQISKKLKGVEQEGFVLHYPLANVRVKIKGDDYCRIHRAVCGLTKRRIWEVLQLDNNNAAFLELWKILPKEYQHVAITWRQELINEKNKILEHVHAAMLHIDKMYTGNVVPTRKEIVNELQAHHKDVFHEVMYLIDNKPERIQELVWKRVYPEHDLPVFDVEVKQ